PAVAGEPRLRRARRCVGHQSRRGGDTLLRQVDGARRRWNEGRSDRARRLLAAGPERRPRRADPRPLPGAGRGGTAAMGVAIIDYGSGNLKSAAKAFERAARATGDAVAVTSDPEAVAKADRIVLPGVGAFADCRRGLDAVPGMVEALNEAVIARGKPFLGICV